MPLKMAAPRPQYIPLPTLPGLPPIPIPNNGIPNPVPAIKADVNAVKTAAGILSDPVRIGEALVGLILIAVGVSAMLKGTTVGNAASGAAGLAMPEFKAAKAVKHAGAMSHARESGKLAARAAARGNGMT